MNENFTPIKHISPIGFKNRFIYFLRLIVDFQFNTIYFNLKSVLPNSTGKVLDVGCGDSPYKHLLNIKTTEYFGIDVKESANFNYNRNDITFFDGINIPFYSDYFDVIICTEVLEHTLNAEKLITEMKRVLKNNGKIILTVPWSARNHYIPYDYYRYTGTTLSILFSDFSNLTIKPRGTDITVIISKIIVAYFRQFAILNLKQFPKFILSLPFILMFTPILFLIIIWGHFSILFNIGSIDDCLGYYLIAKK